MKPEDPRELIETKHRTELVTARASDGDILLALSQQRGQYDDATLDAIHQIALERGLIAEAIFDSVQAPIPVRPTKAPPNPLTKWIAGALTLALWLVTWPQILPKEADLPPCHMMVLIGISGAWTVHAVGRDIRHKRQSRHSAS